MRKRYEWTRIFLKTAKKGCVFKRTTDTCGQGVRHFRRDKIVGTYVHVSGCQESAPADVKCQTSLESKTYIIGI